MLMHCKRILIQTILAFFGMLFYLAVASYFQWIAPIWWGGEALLFTVYLGGIPVIISSAMLYVISGSSSALKFASDSYSAGRISAILLGVLFFPSFEIFTYVKQMIPGWKALNPLWALTIGLALTSIIDLVITLLLIVVLFNRLLKKT